MHRFRFHPRSAHPGRFARSALMAAALPMLSSPVWGSSCTDMQRDLLERKNLVSSIQAMTQGGKKMDPEEACTVFGKLVANGTATFTWAEANKDRCQVPDNFVESLKADHDRVVRMRERACAFAAVSKSRRWRQDPPLPTPPEFTPGFMDWMPRWLPRPAPASIPWAAD